MKSSLFKTLTMVFLGLSLSSCSLRKDPRLSQLPSLSRGDMIFLDLNCGPICDAIEDVTLEQFNVKQPRLSHVAVMVNDHEALEAWPQGGVRIVHINELLSRVSEGFEQANGFYFGILKPEYRSLGLQATSQMEAFLGMPYNDTFEWNKNRYYCSELVSLGYENFFSPRPMFFGKKKSPAYKVWKDYFTEIGLEVPDGQPGVSPLGIYLEGQKSLFLKP